MNSKIFSKLFIIVLLSAPSVVLAGWSGLYAGPAVSNRSMDADWTTTVAYNPGGFVIPFTSSPDESYSDSAAGIGGYIGFNWGLGPTWVAGVEFGLGLGSNEEEVNRIPGLVTGTMNYTTVEAGMNAGILGRAGLLVTPTTMLYAALGFGFQEIDVETTCLADTTVCNPATGVQSNSESSTESGAILALGVEMQMWGNWTGRAQYSYADYSEFEFTALPPHSNSYGADAAVDMNMSTFSLGLAYRF